MIVGQRIRDRLPVAEISQAELARRVGMSQSGMVNLIAGRSRSTTYLHRIARELSTTPAYLNGETDDPDENAPPPPPEPMYQFVSMPTAFPNEDALAAMFEGLLLPLDLNQPIDELARTLAKRLPIGLAQLRDLLPRTPSAVGAALGRAAPQPTPDHRESQQVRRT